jgi:hypothetical protein
MAQSDQSAEYDNLQEGKLLRAEQDAQAKIKGAQAVGQVAGKIGPALDEAQSAGIEAEKTNADAETLDWLYKNAPGNTKLMSEYAMSRLGLSQEDMGRMEPMIRAVLHQSKKDASPKPIYDFYKQIDDLKAAQDELAAKAKTAKVSETGSRAMDIIAEVSDKWKAKNPGAILDSTQFISLLNSPENAKYKEEWKLIPTANIQAALTTRFKDAQFNEGQYKTDVANAVKVNSGSSKANALLSEQMVTNSNNLPDLRKRNQNLRIALKDMTPEQKDATVASGWNRFKMYLQNRLTNTDDANLASIARAVLPESVAAAMDADQKVTGPLWQMIVTHLKNISGAAVTESEYKRFADALGLSSADPIAQENAIAYFMGTSLASMEAERDASMSSIGDEGRKRLVEGGHLANEPATKAITKIRKQAADGNEGAKKVLEAYNQARSGDATPEQRNALANAEKDGTAKANSPEHREGDVWSDDQYTYRMYQGKVQRKAK